MDFITSDKSLQVGDLVFNGYSKNNYLYKVTQITRRFLTKEDLRYNAYQGGQVGDEYNPYVTIEAVADLDLKANPKAKLRKNVKGLDASYLTKVDPNFLQEYKDRLLKVIDQFWP